MAELLAPPMLLRGVQHLQHRPQLDFQSAPPTLPPRDGWSQHPLDAVILPSPGSPSASERPLSTSLACTNTDVLSPFSCRPLTVGR